MDAPAHAPTQRNGTSSGRPTLEELSKRALAASGLGLPAITGGARSKDIAAIRRHIIRAAHGFGYSLTQIANFLDVSKSAACRALAKSAEVNKVNEVNA